MKLILRVCNDIMTVRNDVPTAGTTLRRGISNNVHFIQCISVLMILNRFHKLKP